MHVIAPQGWLASNAEAAVRDELAPGLLKRLLKSGRFACETVFVRAHEDEVQIEESITFEVLSATAGVEPLIAAVEHPSGALTFHAPSASINGSQFRADLHPNRSGIPKNRIGQWRVFFLRSSGDLIARDVQALAASWERDFWTRRGDSLGWVRFSEETLKSGEMTPVKTLDTSAQARARHLIFLHGALSTTEASFRSLASGPTARTFWNALAHKYDDRLYGYNHLTVSATPEENARTLLQSLPPSTCFCDIVAFSRGGLVTRCLAETLGQTEEFAHRLQIGQAILVATPNLGIELADPTRFLSLLNWLGAIDDVCVDTPFKSAVDFISEALYWQAHGVSEMPAGLAAMGSESPTISSLRDSSPRRDITYRTIASCYPLDDNTVARVNDLHINNVLQSPNDLFVNTIHASCPTRSASGEQPSVALKDYENALVFTANRKVNHCTILSQTDTVDFILSSLASPYTAANGPEEADPVSVSSSHKLLQGGIDAGVSTTTLKENEMSSQKTFIGDSFNDDIFMLSVLAANPEDRHDFQLFATYRNARVLEKLRARGDEAGQRWQRIIAVQERIHDFLDGKPGAAPLPEGDELMDLGASLFETLFPGEVRRLYDIARASQPAGRLNIIFTSMVSWIADKPWEFAYDPSRRTFLATEDANFVRNVHTAVPADQLGPNEGPLKILVVVAQPLALPTLSTDQEIEVVRAGFKNLIDAHLAEVDVLPKATPDLLHRKLLSARTRYDVLHFIGHGVYDEQKNSGFLAFENANGALQLINAATLRLILARRGIRLVFLNACETGMGGRADFNRGVAPALVAGGVPAVVANQYSVLDSSATTFSRLFYWALAQGHNLGDAAREARICLSYSIGSDVIDWAIPVIFARNPSDRLCVGSGSDVFDSMAGPTTSARRTARGTTLRIALWDVQSALPQLEQVAEKLNSVQSRIYFQPVTFSAPLGTWQRESEHGVLYLRGELVVAKLKDKPVQLGVDKMLCFTTFPLKFEDTRDLFYWTDYQSTIAIYSLAGFLDQLEPPATSLERLIANACVTLVGGLASHDDGSKNCPFYYNDERDIRWVAGPLQICQADLDKLKAASAEIEVLQKLLCAYP